jgi:drug/metabolite transporter (DMT)-like permease
MSTALQRKLMVPRHRLAQLAPGAFVLLWSTGFIGAKLGLPYAEPLTFLAWRMAIVVVLLVIVALVARAPWPRSASMVSHMAVAGVLVHAVTLGGVFSAISRGLSSGVAALIVGLQPLLTAVVAGLWLEERIRARQWIGFVLGLLGVALVVSSKLSGADLDARAIGFAVLALFGMTAGTLYQKRYCGDMDFRTGGVIQYAAAGIVLFAGALASENLDVRWSAEFVFALLWLCLVLSVGAVSLLYLLIRRGAAARVSSLFYLVPPVTALMGYALFDETLGVTALAGMALTAVAVAMVVRAA